MIEVETRELGFVYPDGTRALVGVSVKFEPGSRVAIIGQNGSGKSTLVRHFNGLLRATEGTVLVNGRDVRDRHVADVAKLVGISFQNPDRQIFSAKAKSEVQFGPRNIGLRGAKLEARVTDALELVGLSSHSDTNPYDLGFSERKLLALASIVAMGTPAIVLDEPTTGQDANGVARVQQLVAALSAEGRTVIAISHDMAFVAESFERVVVMRDGAVVLDGPTDTVFAEDSWPILRSTNLEPPYASTVGAKLNLGSTPTVASVVAALSKVRG